MSYTYDYPRPAVTADAILFCVGQEQTKVLLIERDKPPFDGMWAFPGGFLDMDEDLKVAAARELEEETGVSGVELVQFKAYGSLGRDPRHRTITVVYCGVVEEELPVKAADDARSVKWFAIDDLPPLAFDHEVILREAMEAFFE